MGDPWSQFRDVDESELAGATRTPSGWDAFPNADGALLGTSFAQAARAQGAPSLGSSAPKPPPVFAGPPSAMAPPGMSFIDYLRLTKPMLFNRLAPNSSQITSGISMPKPTAFGLFGRGPETTVVTADPMLSASYGLEAQPALSPQGDAFLRAVELNSVTMSPELQRKYQVDPATHLYPKAKDTFGIGHRIEPGDADWVAKLGGMSLPAQEQKAESLYAADRQHWYDSVRRAVGPQYFDNLSQNQKDALVTTAFNGGNKSAVGAAMKADIWNDRLDLVPNQFNGWYKQKKIDPGLVRRQLKERALWNGNYSYEPTDAEIDAVIEKGGY